MVVTQHNRIPSGWQFVDRDFGGVFVNEAVLLSGPNRSGKTSAALRWAMEGVYRNEPTLYFTSESARGVYETATRLRLPVKTPIDEQKLILLEFNGSDEHYSATELAAKRFAQFKKIIESKGVKRLVVDSLLPWIISEPPKVVAHLITEMMAEIQKMEVTALYTIPRPKSDAAAELLYILQDQTPVALSILPQSDPNQPVFEICRFSGAVNLPVIYPVKLSPDQLMESSELGRGPESDREDEGPSSSSGGISFSDNLL